MFEKDNAIDWHKLTDKDFAEALSDRSKKHRKVMTTPISELTNEQMMAAIKLGRFDKQH